MESVLLIALQVVIASCQSLFCRLHTISRHGEGALPFAIFYAAFAGICTLAMNGFHYAPSLITLILGLMNAGALLTYNVVMVNAGNLGSYAFMMIGVLSGGILVPMVYEWLYLKVPMSAWKLFAVLLMLGAFVLMNLEGIRGKKNPKYLLLVGVLFVVNGLYVTLMNLQQTLMDFTQRNEMIVTTYLGMGVLTSLVSIAVRRRRFFEDYRMSFPAWAFMILSASCAAASVNLMMVIMKKVELTVMNVPINGGVLVLSAVFAFALFKEKVTLPKLLGIFLACASVVILCL